MVSAAFGGGAGVATFRTMVVGGLWFVWMATFGTASASATAGFGFGDRVQVVTVVMLTVGTADGTDGTVF